MREMEQQRMNESARQTADSHCLGSDKLKSMADGLNAVGTYVSDTVETVQLRMAEFRDHGFDRMKDDVVAYTKKQPTNALLVAAGLGVLLGIFSGLRRR